MCSQNLRNGIFQLSDFISLQRYILYIFIHAEQKRSVIEAGVGAEGKAVIHKNAPHLHRRTLRQLNYRQRFFLTLRRKLWLAFNLLIFFFFRSSSCIVLCHSKVKWGGVEILEDTEGWGLARGSFHGEGSGIQGMFITISFFNRCS